MKQRILITGAAGALAQQVIRRLRHHYELVVVDSRTEVTTPPDIPSFRCEFLHRSFEELFRKYQFDGVIHLGRISSRESTRERRYNANVLGTQRLLEHCVKYEVKQLVVLSTHFVYGAHPYNPAFITEDAPLKAAGFTQDLVDTVELENLVMIHLWKYPQLRTTLLRPCHIVGPGINNSMSQLLSQPRSPALMGFSPLMQFIHVSDAAKAIVLAYQGDQPGIYNLASDDCVAFQDALRLSGCKILPIPSIPESLCRAVVKKLDKRYFQLFLLDYFKYATTIDGRLFKNTFNYEPDISLTEIFQHYANLKS
ncbi:MAG: NAD-dependent epimerase/dehydratase family protein [Moraxellaceae bacterium]|nr:NAD-dependent epimerase/dehydratase family protein [Moraxellaceae bacterium]MDP1776233.1 NAD-dependent epimerase/dehydratase family protein [Moraxellaceae bacterium]